MFPGYITKDPSRYEEPQYVAIQEHDRPLPRTGHGRGACGFGPEGRRVRGRRLAAGGQPAGLRPDQGGGSSAELPGGRPDRRRPADRALRRRLDRDRQRRARWSSARHWPTAAGTDPRRVAVHTLHQHDAPGCDFSTDRLLAEQGINREVFDAAFSRAVIARAAAAVRVATARAEPVTHLGLGQAEVEKVASNRRILGPDGKVKHVR